MIFKEITKLTKQEKDKILNRRSKIDTALVKDIITDVKRKGDLALKEYTKRFDGVEIEDLRVSPEEFEEAMASADPDIVESIKKAHKNILLFHQKQPEKEWWIEEDGIKLGQISKPVDSVGCYIPGGRAFYPSTVLMTVTPAKVAGVGRIVCATPPRNDGKINEYTLVSCKIAGVDEAYKVGGAQAIAALAFGTESVPKVDLIVGPGNIFVTAAKKAVFGDVGIDMLAGPSEVLIIADSSANTDYIVSDMLAQAEHDPEASCILISTDKGVALGVKKILEEITDKAPKALSNASILVAKDLDEAINFSNRYAPEHLEIVADNEESALEKIKNAGSVFLGPYSPVSAGDYASGPNHVLPTGGCARFQSGLNVGHFMKKISVQKISREGLTKIGKTVVTLSKAEGLRYHSESVKKRL
jgi:histidinol dehydrogenase